MSKASAQSDHRQFVVLLVEQIELCSLAAVPEDQANRWKVCMTTELAAKCKSLVFNYGLTFFMRKLRRHTGCFSTSKGSFQRSQASGLLPKGNMIRLNY